MDEYFLSLCNPTKYNYAYGCYKRLITIYFSKSNFYIGISRKILLSYMKIGLVNSRSLKFTAFSLDILQTKTTSKLVYTKYASKWLVQSSSNNIQYLFKIYIASNLAGTSTMLVKTKSRYMLPPRSLDANDIP